MTYDVVHQYECREPSDFRIKPKITTKTISGTFFLRSIAHGSEHDSSEIKLETHDKIKSEDFLELGGDVVRIISDNWYNELVSCKEQLDKLTLTKGQNK
jgi:fructose-1-phosphate kinase PfkB-like protein